MQPFLHKHESWKYQEEVRIFNLEGPSKVKKLEELKLNLTKIIFGRRVKEEVRLAIKKTTSEYTNIEYYEYLRPAVEGGPYWNLKEWGK